MRVPTYDNFQASPNALPPTRITSPDMPDVAGTQGQQLAQGAMRLGDTANRIALDMQADANKVRVDDAMNQLVRARTDMQVKAFQLRGRDALERPDGKSLADEFGSELDKQVAKIGQGLGNDAQRAVFTAQAGAVRNQFHGALSSHMVEQQRVFQKETHAATVEIAQNQAALLWGDATMRQQSSDAIRASVDGMAKIEGWDDKTREAELTKQMSPMHLGIIKGMLQAGQGTMAREYLSENSAGMTLQARAMAQDMTKGADSLERAQAFADEVLTKGMGQAEALALARQRFTGDDEVRAVAEVRQRFAEDEAARAQRAKDVGRQGWSIIMDQGRMSAIPPDLMTSLRRDAPEEERQMRDWLEAKWRRAKADAEGKKGDDGFDVYYGLRRMAMDNPQAFVDLDLRKSAPYLSKGMLESLTDIQGGIVKGDAKAMESQRVLKSTLGVIKAEVQAIGIDLSPKEGTPQAKETATFLGALSRSLDEATSAKGAPLTPDEAKRIGMSMVREGIEQGSGVFGFFQTKKRGYQIATDPNLPAGASYVAANFDDIPTAVRDSLVSDYRTKNNLGTRPLTSQQKAEIERAYTRGVQTGRIK